METTQNIIQRQTNTPINMLVKKMSLIFFVIFKVFMILNMVLLGITIYLMVMASSGVGVFLFVVFLLNFIIMLIFFNFISICVKLFICMSMALTNNSIYQSMQEEENSWVFSVMFFPLVTEADEEEFMALIQQQSFDQGNEEQQNIQPPSTERLDSLENKWGFVMTSKEAPQPQTEDNQELCIICSNEYVYNYPTHRGCVELSCGCSVIFHKKCVLEWFHFNEKKNPDDDTKVNVSCPNCRKIFIS